MDRIEDSLMTKHRPPEKWEWDQIKKKIMKQLKKNKGMEDGGLAEAIEKLKAKGHGKMAVVEKQYQPKKKG